MSAQVIYVVCAEGEETLADQLADPLRKAGYTVAHDGTLVIGESRWAEAEKALASSSPIVLCATVKAMGSAWSHRIINAAHGRNPVRVFVVQMEKQAYVELLALDGKIAMYCEDPARAISALLDALAKNFPPGELTLAKERQPSAEREPDFLDGLIESATVDTEALARFRSELRPEFSVRYSPTMTVWEFLSRENLWAHGNLTRTGALLFATSPTVVCPAAMVKCAHYRGIDRSANREIATYDGTVPAQIVAARQFVAERVSSGEAPSADRAQLATVYEYSMIAVREIIANALVHRDYVTTDSCVHVRLFADRLEVSSPGSWVGRTLSPEMQYDLSELIGQSIKRNYRLAHVLSYIRLVEGEGSGIPAALRSCQAIDSPMPKVVQEDGFVTVILRPRERDADKEPVSFAHVLRQIRVSAGLTQEELAAAANVSARSISDLERSVNLTARRSIVERLADALHLTGAIREDFEAAGRGQRVTPIASETPPRDLASLTDRDPADRFATIARTLPRDISSFTGRESELHELGSAMAGAGGVVAIRAIGGMAGVGKTALAVHAAHQLAPQFPDGQIYLPLHAHTAGRGPVDPADALASLLQAIGVSAQQIPAGIEARANLWRDSVTALRLLLVLDDAVDSDQVRPLLPGTAGSLALITSRRRLTALEDAVVLSLDVLSAAESAELFVKLAARPELGVNDAAVAEICRSSGYLPLAIGLLARRIRHHDSWTATDFMIELTAAQDRLAPMRAENLSVAAAFDLSYRSLPADEQQMFRRLGLHPGADIDAYSAAALSDVSLAAARTQLEKLYDRNLLGEPARDRYRFHELIREYARQLAQGESPEMRAAAVDRLFDYYLYTVEIANKRLGRGRTASRLSEHVKPVHAPEIADRVQAVDWLAAERINLHAIAESAAMAGRPVHAVAIPAAMHTFLRSQGHWDQAMSLQHAAVEVAREIGTKHAQARALTDLGDIQYLIDDYQAAEESLGAALRLCTELNDRHEQADALRELGAVQHARGEHHAAVASLTGALELYTDLGEWLGEADALRELGAVWAASGQYQQASTSLDKALGLYRDLDDGIGEADALSDIGVVLLATGVFRAAASSQHQALDLYRAYGDRLGEGKALTRLGTIQQMSGYHDAARASLNQAVLLYTSLGEQSGQAEALNYLGELSQRTGDRDSARELHEQALAIAERISTPREQARAYEGIGRSYLAADQAELGEAAVRQAIRIYQQIGSPHASRAAKLLRDHEK